MKSKDLVGCLLVIENWLAKFMFFFRYIQFKIKVADGTPSTWIGR